VKSTETTNLSSQLKEIAKDLSFLAKPRYPLKTLEQMFPQFKSFLKVLIDLETPFEISTDLKKKSIDDFLKNLEQSSLPFYLKTIFKARAEDYLILTHMMENYGKPLFYESSKKLYGTSLLTSQEKNFSFFCNGIENKITLSESEKKISGFDALNYIQNKLEETFPKESFTTAPSSSLLSDSSSGRKSFKLNISKSYSLEELNIFLVHEGWAHLGTSLNGAMQSEHLWLSTWSPQTTCLQEGLAILTELISGSMTKERWRKIKIRHQGTSMAEKGSSIAQVYEFLRDEHLSELDAFKLSLRIFRGVPLEGGMSFTKELLYLYGLMKILKHLQMYNPNLKSFWAGKMSFEEHTLLHHHTSLLQENPTYFPKQLENPETLKRLEELKILSQIAFKSDF